LLGGRLDAPVKLRLEQEVNRRILEPFENKHYFWEDVEHNWAAVCAGSVGAAFMYMSPERFTKVQPRIDAAMQNFLAGYKSDGICREGIGYWNYGFGFFIYYADLLSAFSDGRENYFADEKVRAIASFAQNVFLQGNTVVSFADADMTSGVLTGLMHYLKTRYPGDVSIISQGYPCSYKNGRGDKCYRWASLFRNFIWYNPKHAEREPLKQGTFSFADSAWYVSRRADYAFAAKAGDNEEPHNHNDIGTFIITRDAAQVICDLGAGEYTRQYFEEGVRETFLCVSSRGHNVPIVGGQFQKRGPEYTGTVTHSDENAFAVEMQGAYGIEELTKLSRSFRLEDNRIFLTDMFEFSAAPLDVTERFVTLYQPVAAVGSIKVGSVTIEYDENACVLAVTTEDYVDHGRIPQTAYCIDFAVKDTSVPFEICFNII